MPADPFFRRTLHDKDTQEVQVFAGGGEDRVVTVGRPGPITVRVIGGSGHVVVDDAQGGGTELSDSARGEIHAGPGSRLDRRAYTPPPPPKNAPWIPPRDWGRDTFVGPWLGYGTDVARGIYVGAGFRVTSTSRSYSWKRRVGKGDV